MTEEKQGGTTPPAEAAAEAPAPEKTDATVAVADEPATGSAAAPAAGDASATATPAETTSETPAEPETAEATATEATATEATATATEATATATEAVPAEAVAPQAEAEAAQTPEAPQAEPEGSKADAEATASSDSTTAGPDQAGAELAEAAAESAVDETETSATATAAPEPAMAEPAGPEPTTMEELLAEQDSDIKSFKHGDVVEGKVVRIDKDEILVDIGAKSEGVVSNRELFGRNTETQPQLNIGDIVLVYVLQPESPEGHVVLSLRRAGLERKWRAMQEQFEAGVIIEAPVIDHNKGGLIVDCGIRGFVPISQIVDFPRRPQNDQPRDAAQEIAEKLQPYVGRKLRLKILEVNRKANRLILSEKVALYEERREKRDELFSSLQVGQRVKGSVRSIAPFGVFVDLGGIDGLVHKSELSWNKVNNPEGGYRVGEEVEAEVIDINHERGRISLSIRRLQPDPWHTTVADFKVGDLIDGTVTKLVNFGAFVRVRDGLEGLIHISELSNQRVAHPGDVVHEGQQLKLRIISLDSERHRLGLSLKQAEDVPMRAAAEAMPSMPSGARGDRPDRAERRARGAERERQRAYTASDAVQEPEGGIDTTLAAAFAGVREQLARAEASAEPAAEAATAEPETATAEPETATAEPETVTSEVETATMETEAPTAEQGAAKPEAEAETVAAADDGAATTEEPKARTAKGKAAKSAKATATDDAAEPVDKAATEPVADDAETVANAEPAIEDAAATDEAAPPVESSPVDTAEAEPEAGEAATEAEADAPEADAPEAAASDAAADSPTEDDEPKS